MPNDINDLDVNDIGLKGIFGERFHDETQSEPEKAASKKKANLPREAENTVQKAVSKPRDAKWEPAPHAPTQMERIKECAKSALCFGGLSLLFFYFQQSGQMVMSASMPCIVACAVLAGFGVGRNFAGGK